LHSLRSSQRPIKEGITKKLPNLSTLLCHRERKRVRSLPGGGLGTVPFRGSDLSLSWSRLPIAINATSLKMFTYIIMEQIRVNIINILMESI